MLNPWLLLGTQIFKSGGTTLKSPKKLDFYVCVSHTAMPVQVGDICYPLWIPSGQRGRRRVKRKEAYRAK